MRAVVQRVSRAQVSVDQALVSSIGPGFLVLLGVEESDNSDDVAYIAGKILGLRVFPDESGKMNRDILQAGGSVLLVSQFTLYGDARHGRRPSFTQAAEPQKANSLYMAVAARLAEQCRVQTGRFGADMQVELVNDGPVTILLESRKLF